jgi:hypothetical protein
MMAEEDIPVSADAMIAGARALGDVLDNMGSMKMGEAAVAIYRAMERVRRAEADELLAHARSVCSRLQLGS